MVGLPPKHLGRPGPPRRKEPSRLQYSRNYVPLSQRTRHLPPGQTATHEAGSTLTWRFRYRHVRSRAEQRYARTKRRFVRGRRR